MTDKELRKLRRQDLLEILVSQEKELDDLKRQLDKANTMLKEKQLKVDKAGSIAEAALQINGVFEAAQAAAAQYLENIQKRSSQQEMVCAQRDAESREEAGRRIAEAAAQCQRMKAETQDKCAKMVADAEQQVRARWVALNQQLEQFYQSHTEIKELLRSMGPASEGGQTR